MLGTYKDPDVRTKADKISAAIGTFIGVCIGVGAVVAFIGIYLEYRALMLSLGM